MAIKIFLGLNAFVFIGYGLACLVSPAIVADAAGLQPTTGDGTVELRAMYGGLQAAVGMLALAALLRAELQRSVLLVLAFLFFGLASARMIGALLAVSDSMSVGSYTWGALSFELVCLVAAVALFSRSGSAGVGTLLGGAAGGSA
jgi:hypothetical protein